MVCRIQPWFGLPPLYTCLGSAKTEIRQISREFIANYGAKAELALIEGFTKDENDVVRGECVKALGSMGVKTIRVIIYGLKDPDFKVRRFDYKNSDKI